VKLPDPGKWLLTGFAAIVAPWQEKLSTIELISPFYKPDIQIAAVVCGVLAGTISLIVWRDIGIKTIQKKLMVSGLAFFTILLSCLGLSYSVGILFEPGQVGTVAIRFGWPMLYLSLHITLATCVALIILALMRSPISD